MDVFSLLKIWRNAGVGDPITAGDFDISSADDEGSFFDLVFTNPNNLEDNDSLVDSPTVTVISDFHSDHYNQFSKLDGGDGDSKSNHTYSSSHAVFFNNKSKILPFDSSNTTKTTTSPRSPFRVLMLGFQNSKTRSVKKEMKCEIEEVTISSLLKRDNSLRHKLKTEKFLDHEQISSKRFSKDAVHKYLNLIKPLYVKVSKKSNEKVRFSDHSPMPSSSSPATTSVFSPRKEEKQGGRTVFKEVRKHLGKSRSSSSSSSTSVKSIPSPATRRDDSALQQQDGIQSAILHCKKSYNSPSQGCNVLSRSGSAPSHGPRISVDEEKRSSI